MRGERLRAQATPPGLLRTSILVLSQHPDAAQQTNKALLGQGRLFQSHRCSPATAATKQSLGLGRLVLKLVPFRRQRGRT